MKKIVSTEAIVIKRKNYKESDKIITLYTKKLGKIRVIGKGIRKISSKRAPHVELFNSINCLIVIHNNYYILSDVQTKIQNEEIRKEMIRCAFAYKAAELLNVLCPEEERDENIYSSAEELFNRLSYSHVKELSLLIEKFSNFLLWSSGYLSQANYLKHEILDDYMQKITERKLNSNNLLTKIDYKVY